MPKKIAIIGDSHFSVEPGFRENHLYPSNWSYQMSERFPQHEYYNFARGGQSIEYFQRALIEAKRLGCDNVFLVKTHIGRMFVDWEPMEERPDPRYEWIDALDIETAGGMETNYNVMYPYFQGFWMVPGNPEYWGSTSNINEENKVNANSFAKAYQTYIAPSESRKQWELYWYNSAPDVYNFENVFLVNWKFSKKSNHSDKEIYTNLQTTVQDALFEHLKPEHRSSNTHIENWKKCMYDSGLCLSEDDDHLTIKGHRIVLEDVILSDPTVLKMLNSK